MSVLIYSCPNSNADYVVLSSGLGGHASFWAPQIAALQQHFHVVTYDQEGCHQDAALLPKPYSIDHMAQQLINLLLAEKIQSFHFIGHALGGHIGMQLALHLSQNNLNMLSLTLINAWAELDPHTQKCFAARTHLLLDSGAEVYVRAQALFLYPPAWISQHHQKIRQMEDQQLLDFPPVHNVKARLEAVQAFHLNEVHQQALAEIPIHLIANQDDFLVPFHQSAQLKQLLPNSQLSLLATGGHASTLTETENMNRCILDFFKK